jgi:hypothetical protein
MNTETITAEALSLPVQQRAAELDQGLSRRIPAEEVRSQAKALLK